MGCGKSSVGRRLSELLCCRFIDLDDAIVEREGRCIPEIFATDGEAEFRRIEKDILNNIIDSYGSGLVIPMTPASASLQHPLAGGGMSSPSASAPAIENTQNKISEINADVILALGGGAVMTPGSAEMVHDNTVCIYLHASVDTLIRHLEGESAQRPILATGDNSRETEYDALHHRIETLMSLRAATYERTAHYIIDTDGKAIEEIAAEIIDHLTPSTQGQE